jgi:TolB-like protein/DNA-binding SARP family transcriptional activator/protein involved in temperature-dependent protein secretion
MDTVPKPTFQLSLLGRFELVGPDGAVDLTSRKLAALLAFLSCTAPRAHSRDKLMTLLWGSHFEAQARQNLRQALTRLRRVLGDDALVTAGESVSLRRDNITCDVTRFEALLADGGREALDRAIGLYRGSLLADFSIPEEAWTEWLGVQRQRLEGLALDAMVKLAEQELQAGNHEQALRAANLAIEVSGMREDAHRLVMRALAAGGRKADAVKHYEQLVALLKRELDVEPDATTLSLAAGLRKPRATKTRPEAQSGTEPEANAVPDGGMVALKLPDRPSIAVLPFANMSGDLEQEYFADGMVDDILSALSRVRWLFVIARQSSFSYKGRAVEVKRIARELGVRYVVEGSVRKSGSRVRVTAQLIDADTDAHIWSDRYDRDLSDVFALQDEITERIVSAIEPTVQAIEIKRALAKPTDTLTAYDSYLRALPHYYSQTREGLGQAEDLLRRAVKLDPDYAEALGTLADVITSRIANGWHASRKQEINDACEAASRALAVGPNNSTCIAAAAYAFAVLARRFEEAVHLAEQAIEVHPNSTFVRNRVGAVYANSGESEKAIAQVSTALRMNPLDNITSTFTFTVGAVAHLFARRFEESLHWGRRAVAITPQARIPLWCAAAALGHLGRHDEARAAIDAILALYPGATLARARIASFRHDWMYDLYLSGLRKAGLPETAAARPGAAPAGTPLAAVDPLPRPDRPSIAMLPFANMSGDPEQEYFADGMVDDILMALSRVGWLFVIARQSSFIYKVRVADVQQIGRELGVRYVVEGSVRKSGTRVRIVAQLIETETGAHIWADRYEGDLKDIFALQDEVTERIVSAVELNVQAAEIRRARAKPTESLTAYDLYLRALPAYFGQTEVDYIRTQALLGKAIEADPAYAEVLGILTDSVTLGTMLGWQVSRTRGCDEARRLADRAVAAGPDNSTCLASAAFTYGSLFHRFEEALDLADRALLLHPNSVFVRNRAASVFAICGESDRAIAQCEAARRMNPLDNKKAATHTFGALSAALYMARRYEESIHAGRRALAFGPNASSARKYVAISLAQLGCIDEARAEIAELLKRHPDASIAVFRQQGFRHKWMHELHLEGLRRAGLREE